MHIVLLILKILGILLLVILGFLLLVLFTVLFVPVRYQLQGRWKGEKWASVKVSWLLSLISFKGAYEMGKGLSGSLRALWFKLWTMGDEDAKKIEEAEETAEEMAEKTVTETAEKAVTLNPVDKAETDRKENREETVRKAEEPEKPEEPEQKETLEKRELVEAAELRSSASKGEKKTHRSVNDEILKVNDEKKTHEPVARIKVMWARLKTLFQKLKFSFLDFCDKLKGIKAFTDEKKAWLEDEKNQESFQLLFKQLKKLFVHMWPCKGKGSVTFGLEEPYYTGQILAGVSFLYPFFYKRLILQPVFDEKCLEAEFDYRGRVRVSYLLWLFWGIYRHKHTWKMIRGFLDRDNSSDE